MNFQKDKHPINLHKISLTSHQIMRTVLYFEVFNYPLTAKEIFECSTITSQENTNQCLEQLVAEHSLTFDTYYHSEYSQSNTKSRKLGNQLAQIQLKLAKRIVKYISQFPFVRGIMLSGSIAKNYMDENSDIDYFIITAPKRLWIARLFFVLTQKIILFNNPKNLCFNYMIDAEHLELNDRSIFTATEAATLLPVYGGEYYRHFLLENNWIRQYYPNYLIQNIEAIPENYSWIKVILEKILDSNFGEWLDNWLMKKTEKRWRKRHDANMFDIEGKNLFLKRYTAKAHTEKHNSNVLTRFEQKLKEFEAKFGINLNE